MARNGANIDPSWAPAAVDDPFEMEVRPLAWRLHGISRAETSWRRTGAVSTFGEGRARSSGGEAATADPRIFRQTSALPDLLSEADSALNT